VGVSATAAPGRTGHRLRLPAFLRELDDDPVAFRTLIAACAAILAVSLLPRVFDPAMPLTRLAVKQDAAMRSLLTVGVVLAKRFVRKVEMTSVRVLTGVLLLAIGALLAAGWI